jgi:hypothetical protein
VCVCVCVCVYVCVCLKPLYNSNLSLDHGEKELSDIKITHTTCNTHCIIVKHYMCDDDERDDLQLFVFSMTDS